jgi:hypothetical protein
MRTVGCFTDATDGPLTCSGLTCAAKSGSWAIALMAGLCRRRVNPEPVSAAHSDQDWADVDIVGFARTATDGGRDDGRATVGPAEAVCPA